MGLQSFRHTRAIQFLFVIKEHRAHLIRDEGNSPDSTIEEVASLCEHQLILIRCRRPIQT